MKSYSVTIQMKATEQFFPVVLFIMLYKVVLTFKSVDEILKCDHSNETYLTVLLQGNICFKIFYKIKRITIMIIVSSSVNPICLLSVGAIYLVSLSRETFYNTCAKMHEA